MNRLKFLREEKGLLQKDIADFLQVSQKAVSFYETEQRDMSPETIIKLAEYFNVTTDFLLGKSDIRNPEELRKDDEFDPSLIRIGLSTNDYNPPTENQIKQIEEFAKLVLENNKKKKNNK